MYTFSKYITWLPILFMLLTSGYASANVLFDQGHKQAFLTENTGELDLSLLADLFREEGVDVRSTSSPLSKETLQGLDGLVISGPFAPLTGSEEAAVLEYLYNGGKLAIMLHIPFPLDELLFQLGVVYSTGVIREQNNMIQEKMTDFSAATSGNHPLIKGVDHFALYGAWAVNGQNNTIHGLAATSSHAWVDLDRNDQLSAGDAMQKLDVAVTGSLGSGEFVVFGDDAIFQNRFIHNENERLARNLVQWFVHHKGEE